MVDVKDAMTHRLLVDAGIAAGMRVLDVGCGSGDVSFMLAQMVGEDGQVVGVDRIPARLELSVRAPEEGKRYALQTTRAAAAALQRRGGIGI